MIIINSIVQHESIETVKPLSMKAENIFGKLANVDIDFKFWYQFSLFLQL